MAYDFLFNTQNTTQCLLETYIDFWLVEIQSKLFQIFFKVIFITNFVRWIYLAQCEDKKPKTVPSHQCTGDFSLPWGLLTVYFLIRPPERFWSMSLSCDLLEMATIYTTDLKKPLIFHITLQLHVRAAASIVDYPSSDLQNPVWRPWRALFFKGHLLLLIDVSILQDTWLKTNVPKIKNQK